MKTSSATISRTPYYNVTSVVRKKAVDIIITNDGGNYNSLGLNEAVTQFSENTPRTGRDFVKSLRSLQSSFEKNNRDNISQRLHGVKISLASSLVDGDTAYFANLGNTGLSVYGYDGEVLLDSGYKRGTKSGDIDPTHRHLGDKGLELSLTKIPLDEIKTVLLTTPMIRENLGDSQKIYDGFIANAKDVDTAVANISKSLIFPGQRGDFEENFRYGDRVAIARYFQK